MQDYTGAGAPQFNAPADIASGDFGPADHSFFTDDGRAITADGAGAELPVRRAEIQDAFSGNDSIIGTAGVDTLAGGRGGDTIDGAAGSDVMLGEAGDDTLIWNPGGANDTVDGGRGDDTLLFNANNASETITLFSGEGSHLTLTRDAANVNMDITGIERVMFAGSGGGNDTFVIGDLTHSDVRLVDIDLGLVNGEKDGLVDTVATGGSEVADHIVFTNDAGAVSVGGLGTGLIVRNSEQTDRFAVSTGSGDDQIDASRLAGGFKVVLDGGEGQDGVTANGTAAADAITLVGVPGPANPDGDSIEFTVGGVTSLLGLRNVETFSVGAGDGDDVVDAHTYFVSATLTVDGGGGNDTITGGALVDTLTGGKGDDRIDGSGGNDVMLGEAGDDTLVWKPGGGSDTVNGGQGHDTLEFLTTNASETLGLFANAQGHAILTRDVGGIRMDLSDIEKVTFLSGSGGGGGVDHFTIGDLHAAGINQVDIDLRQNGVGDGLSDTVTLISPSQGEQAVHVAGFEVHAGNLEGDLLVLNGFADANLAAAIANHHIFQTGFDTVIADGSGLEVTLHGVSLATLQASDFLFS